MRYHEIIPEAEIVDLTQKRDERRLQNFYRDFHAELGDQVRQRAEHLRAAKENGVFDGFVVGERIRTAHGGVFKITGYGLTPILSLKVAARKREWFQEKGWGDPNFVEHDGKLYEPVIHVEDAEGTQTNLVVAALRALGFTPLRGPQREAQEPGIAEARIEKNLRKPGMRGPSTFVDKQGRTIKLVASKRYPHYPDDPDFSGHVHAEFEGKEVANLFLHVFDRREGAPWVVGRAWVDPPFRRSGLATALYDFAYRQGFRPLKQSSVLSVDGDAFWNSHLRKKAEAGLRDHFTANHINRFHWLPLDGTNIGKSWKR